MAINAYTGLMGSGKSYEVVENVILPALLAGRRVVTNVANLQIDDIAAYLIETAQADPDKLGTICQVTNDDLTRPDFFPFESVDGSPAPLSVVLPGDLVVVDECWRWWAAGAKITRAHMTFFRMHRHFVNPVTGATCDLVLVVQDISDLDRKLKVVVENTYRMSKHKALGVSNRYRVDVFLSYRTSKPPFKSLQRKYNKAIFALYQSYSQGSTAGKEAPIDDRANIFKGMAFKLGIPIFLLVFLGAVWGVWGFFHPDAPPVAGAPGATPSKPGTASKSGAAAPFVPPAPTAPVLSDWQVAGYYAVAGQRFFIITRNGRIRTLINPSGWYSDALRAGGMVDGLTASVYSGAPPGPSILGDTK